MHFEVNMSTRKRTKNELAKDTAFVLGAPLHEKTKYAVLNNVMWKWTEYEGKYKGCRYWTQAAVEHFTLNRKKGLRHEHVVPRKYLITMFFQLENITPDIVYDMLNRFAIGAIVTKNEEQELNRHFKVDMPDEFDDPCNKAYRDPWLRFKHIDLKVIEP